MHLGAFGDGLDAALTRSRAAGVDGWCATAARPTDLPAARAAASRAGAQLAVGLHPWSVGTWTPGDVVDLLEAGPRPDAIGEIGLDRLQPHFDDLQPAALRVQLALARAWERPIVLHCVRAQGELLALLREVGVSPAGGVMHGWIGEPAALAPFLELGLHIGFGHGVLRSSRTLRAAAAVPAERLLFESDAPEGTEGPHAVAQIAARVADARGESVDRVLQRSGEVARRLFGAA